MGGGDGGDGGHWVDITSALKNRSFSGLLLISYLYDFWEYLER